MIWINNLFASLCRETSKNDSSTLQLYSEYRSNYSEYRSKITKHPYNSNNLYPIHEQKRGQFHCAFISAFLLIVHSAQLRELLNSSDNQTLDPLKKLCNDYLEGYVIDPFDIRKAWATITLPQAISLDLFFQQRVDASYTNANSMHDPDELIKELLLNHISGTNAQIPKRKITQHWKILQNTIQNATDQHKKDLSPLINNTTAQEEAGHTINVQLDENNPRFTDLFESACNQKPQDHSGKFLINTTTQVAETQVAQCTCTSESIQYPITPSFLLVTLNRFKQQDQPNFQPVKDIPLDWVLPQTLICESLQDADRTLELYGFSLIAPGHHYVCIKKKDGCWYNCDNLNGSVQQINRASIETLLNGTIKTSCAIYVLYYQKKNISKIENRDSSSKKLLTKPLPLLKGEEQEAEAPPMSLPIESQEKPVTTHVACNTQPPPPSSLPPFQQLTEEEKLAAAPLEENNPPPPAPGIVSMKEALAGCGVPPNLNRAPLNPMEKKGHLQGLKKAPPKKN